MKRRLFAFYPLSAALALASCSGGGGSAGGGPGMPTGAPPVITQSYTFAPGHATAAPGDTAWDIIGVTTTLSGQFGSGGSNAYDTLRVDVTFVQDISNALPAPGQPLSTGTQLGVHVAIDNDGNPATGVYRACDVTSPVAPISYLSDQGNDPSRLSDGNYSIIGANGPIYLGGSNPPSEAVTIVKGHTLSQSFFLPAISVFTGPTAPKIGVVVAALNDNESTDCVPFANGIELFTTSS